MLKKYLIVFFISMLPIIELRGAIPYAVGFNLPLWLSFIIAIIGNGNKENGVIRLSKLYENYFKRLPDSFLICFQNCLMSPTRRE